MEPALSTFSAPPLVPAWAELSGNSRLGFGVRGSTLQPGFEAAKYLNRVGDTTSVVWNPWPESLKTQQQSENTELAQNNTPPPPGQNGQPQNTNTKQLSGDATEYNLPGAKLAYGGKFDGSKMAAAMTPDRAKNGQTVVVSYTSTDANGHQVTTTIRVVVNDTGPFARGANGRALSPLRPDPNIVIDLTPTAMRALTGNSHNRVAVTVTVPNE